jgi:hypothetical protein
MQSGHLRTLSTTGNHDNPLYLDRWVDSSMLIPDKFNINNIFECNCEPYLVHCDMKHSEKFRYRQLSRSDKSYIALCHGHYMDMVNNDAKCGLGYFLTAINVYFELKGFGYDLKELENLIIPETFSRSSYIEKASFHFNKFNDIGAPVNVFLMAHTHKPYIEEITGTYNKDTIEKKLKNFSGDDDIITRVIKQKTTDIIKYFNEDLDWLWSK